MEDDADRHYTILFNQKSGLHAGADSHVGVCVGGIVVSTLLFHPGEWKEMLKHRNSLTPMNQLNLVMPE